MNDTIFKNDYLICELDKSIPVLVHSWVKEAHGQVFRDQLVLVQKEYIKLKDQYPNLKWLADARNLGELTHDDEEWLASEWDKLLFTEAGVKVHAVIMADDIYAGYSMDKFKATAAKKYEEKGVSLNVFLVPENAYKWLKDN